MWLNKLYFQISNSKNKQCLTIDTRDVNDLGPGKFRTSAENGEEQTCYFNRNKSDTHPTSFSARRSQADPIRFSIVKPNSDDGFPQRRDLFSQSTDVRRQSDRRNFRDRSASTRKKPRFFF